MDRSVGRDDVILLPLSVRAKFAAAQHVRLCARLLMLLPGRGEGVHNLIRMCRHPVLAEDTDPYPLGGGLDHENPALGDRGRRVLGLRHH